jgi:zinc transport system permease protein
MPDVWLGHWINELAQLFGVYSSQVRPVLAVLLVSGTCGLVGSLVIGNRMAFFSDAMAHTAFAGVAFALLCIVLAAGIRTTREADEYLWLVPVVMALFGSAAGLAIALVRERTNLATDTVIGVFFAASLGIAALLLPILRGRVKVDPEQIMFGQLAGVDERDLLVLLALAAITLVVVIWKSNQFLLASFNPSLAQSRGIPVRFNNYLFVVLLACVVNLCIQAVGILLINAMLIVPAAAAANVSGNLRRMFWFTLGGSLITGILGYHFSTKVIIQDPIGGTLRPGPGGAIVLACVGWFVLSLGVRVVRQRFFGLPASCDHHSCSSPHPDGQYPHAH